MDVEINVTTAPTVVEVANQQVTVEATMNSQEVTVETTVNSIVVSDLHVSDNPPADTSKVWIDITGL